jgi:hypothetical protein
MDRLLALGQRSCSQCPVCARCRDIQGSRRRELAVSCAAIFGSSPSARAAGSGYIGEPVKTMSEGRIDFDPKTRRIIALRSGYRCAHPECDGRTTVGPAKQPDKYEDTGRASHIFAASKRGPRGQGNLSPEELGSATNGIWLCAEHADQVDKNDGKDYPPPVLLGWKAGHEFRIAREHGAMLNPFGWIENLHIIDAPVFKPDQRIALANVNVIVGDDGVGKTTICEWLWSLKDSSTLWRWGAYPTRPSRTYRDVKVAIDLRAPDRLHVELEIRGGRSTFTLDNRRYPFSPIGYEVSALSRESRFLSPAEGDQIFIAKCLQMDEIGVQALADYITESPGIFLKAADWREAEEDEDSEPVRYLYCELADGQKRPFRSLSGETGAVLVDLAIARAKILAARRPTLLIIETGGLSMEEKFLSLFLKELSSPDIPFQSIVVTTQLEDDAVWGGWQVIRLNRPAALGVEGQFTEIIVGDMHAVSKVR